MLQAGRFAGLRPNEVMNFFNYLILPATLGPRVYSTCNRNEYQKERKNFWGVECSQCVRLTTSPPSVSVDGLDKVGSSISHNPIGLHGLLWG
jgi:hypothetical protein